jgi:hypothetical protein
MASMSDGSIEVPEGHSRSPISVHPFAGIVATALGLVVGHEVGVKRRRARVISQLTAQYRRAFQPLTGISSNRPRSG